jgi:hypothetical protein
VRMHVNHAYTLRKNSGVLIWVSYKLQHGGGGGKREVISNQ